MDQAWTDPDLRNQRRICESDLLPDQVPEQIVCSDQRLQHGDGMPPVLRGPDQARKC